MKTEAELIEILRVAVGDDYGAQRKFAEAHRLNPFFVSDLLRGKRKIPPRVAAALGYRKIVHWEKIPTKTLA